MDDKQFDHILKNKLESLSPAYKEEAWKALDYKLDLIAPIPWYSRWKSLLVAGSLGVITLLNIGLLYKVDNEQDQLEKLVALLNERDFQTADTIYVTTENYLSPSYLHKAYDDGLAFAKASGASNSILDPHVIYRITDGVAREIPVQSGAPVYSETPIKRQEQQTLAINRQISSVDAIDPFDLEYNLQAPDGESMYVRGVVLPPSKSKWKHPVDPRVGLSIGYLIPDPDIGERFVTSRQSLLIETPIRGNFHLLSGLSYQEVPYKLDDVDDNNFERTTLLEYPEFGSFPTSPDEISVDNTMLQVPIYFRYYKPLNATWSVFAGGGPTVDILLKQKFTYSFLEIRDEQLIKFDEIRESNDIKVSLGSISGNIGVEHFFNPRLAGQIELNYQYGLGSIGLEGRTFNSFAVSGGLLYKLNNPRRR
jgi:hypothetical protein